nr:hypothetical protein Beed-S103_00014 [Bovine alphaherpesvirus 5]WHT50132.1 hypothetical protein HeiferVagina-S102_00014 [Bovine alphaherpesvirus 1]WHT50218.1 hypothetical protein Milk-S104_00014 [Bovine alphaherpesvirus 1]WHT50306.1 hypothetical protein Docile-S101_00014 [Bovine alphaherpesvirus 1]
MLPQPSHRPPADEGEARAPAADLLRGAGPIASASLIGRQLADVAALLSPFGASLRNAFLVFSREGMLVHSGLYDEQVYVAVPAAKFTSFQWAPAREDARAVFLANVDSRRGLLDAFRADKTRKVQNVAFLITGEPPASVLTQVTYFREADAFSQASLVKHELGEYSIMLPTRGADLAVSLSRPQLSKLQAVAKDPGGAVTFSYRRARRLGAESASGRVSFAARLEDGEPGAEPALEPGPGAGSERILARAQGAARKAALLEARCFGGAPDFRLELESPSGFRRLLQKVRQVGGDALLRFYLAPAGAATMSVSTAAPEGLTVFFFCRPAPAAADPADDDDDDGGDRAGPAPRPPAKRPAAPGRARGGPGPEAGARARKRPRAGAAAPNADSGPDRGGEEGGEAPLGETNKESR